MYCCTHCQVNQCCQSFVDLTVIHKVSGIFSIPMTSWSSVGIQILQQHLKKMKKKKKPKHNKAKQGGGRRYFKNSVFKLADSEFLVSLRNRLKMKASQCSVWWLKYKQMDNFTEENAFCTERKVKNSIRILPRKQLWMRFTCDYRLVHWFKHSTAQQFWRQ